MRDRAFVLGALFYDFEELCPKWPQNLRKTGSPLHYHAVSTQDQKCALPSGQSRLLDDFVDRILRGAAKDGEDGAIRTSGNCVIAPQARRHHATIDIQYFCEFFAVKADLLLPFASWPRWKFYD